MTTAPTNHGLDRAKMLLIFIDEDDTFGAMPLYEAVVRRLRKLDISGATVIRGIMGYGAQHRIFGSKVLGISENRPVTILSIEKEEKLLSALPEIKGMIREGLIAIVEAQVDLCTVHVRPPHGTPPAKGS